MGQIKAPLALRSTPSTAAPKTLLLSHLEAGSTGCLHATQPGGVALAVYVMLGEILAAHSSQDRERLLLLLQNTGAVDAARLAALRRARAEGRTITEELFETVPDELLQDLMAERFRENLFQFLQGSTEPTFEALESVFVENIQVGHESRSLIDELDRQVQVAERLRGPPGLVLAPGHGSLKDPRHLKIAGLCSPRLPLPDLLARAPFESGRTLAMVAEMLERGILVPVTAHEGDTTDRPRPRPEAPPKVVVTPGRPDPRERRPEAKDAVAAALASAVSAAVAKVGRQRDAGTAPTIPPDAPPTLPPTRPPPRPPEPSVRRASPERPVAPAVDKAPLPPPHRGAPPPAPGFDPISSPIARKVAPLAVPAAPPKPSPMRELHAFDADHPTEEVVDDEMAAFQDYDQARVGGEFITERELLDRVEVLDAPPPERKTLPPPPPRPVENITIEMEDAEHATRAELAHAVSLNFAGPKLTDDDARRKLDVVNEMLARLVSALETAEGPGAGQPRAQLLVEGTPGAFAALFKGVEVDVSGRLPADTVLKNLRKRPASEHRRLLNRGLQDLIDRALSLASEELDDAALESLLESVAGYQQRLGM